jgi:poly(glycerol-phosphate) alpha-glucosyltransferase
MELVHLHGIWMYPSVVAWRWSQSSRRPVVISSHGMLDPWALARSKLKKSIARLLFEDSNLRSARCLRSLCTAETNAIRRLGFRNPICQIPNGVDIPDRATQARAKPSQPTRKVLLYVGRLHPKKQLPSLLRAWKRLESLSIPGARDWELAIVGWDDANHQGELDALIDDLDVSRVRISGPVFGEELTSLLFEAAAFILPSLSEGLPMAVLEAWAHQLPVVMTPQCNLSDGFACGAAIKTAPDPESISRAIADLLQMSDYERADMGKRGLDLVKRKYSWPGVAEQVAAVYQWLLGGGPVPASVIL